MKWKRKAPREGDIRTRTKFAWLPTDVDDLEYDVVVWLESYKVTEVYTRYVLESRWVITSRRALYDVF